MSRVRIVGGTIEDLHKLGLTSDPLKATAGRSFLPEQGGHLGDAAGMLVDAIGRYEEVPEGRFTERAKDLCRNHQVEDARFRVEGLPDLDILIVLHPSKEIVKGVNDEDIQVDKYVVFARERGGNGESLDVHGNCYTCNFADQRYKSADSTKRNVKAKAHDCFRQKMFPNMVPVLFAKAHGIDDAEELAKELKSAWEMTRQAETEGSDNRDWSGAIEMPFSGDYLAGFLAGRPNAWSTLAAE